MDPVAIAIMLGASMLLAVASLALLACVGSTRIRRRDGR